ncbi:MAG: hypothetical protein ACRYFR_14250 [Janthinobacterium lividum]
MKLTAALTIAALSLAMVDCGSKKDDATPNVIPTLMSYVSLYVDGNGPTNLPASALSYGVDAAYGAALTASADVQGTNYAAVSNLADLVKDSTLTPFKDINPRTGVLRVSLPKGVSNVFNDMKDNHVTFTATTNDGAFIHYQSHNPYGIGTRKALRQELVDVLTSTAKKTTANNQPNVYSFTYHP